MYQIRLAPQPPTRTKRREALAVMNERRLTHILSETVTLAEAGAPDEAFCSFAGKIGK